MFEPTLLLTYIAACFAFSLVPGPSVTLVLASSLSRGTGAGLLTILGTNLSMLSMVFIVGLGLEAIVHAVGAAFFWIKLAGACYLVWIGWTMFSAKDSLKFDKDLPPISAGSLILQGALVNWGNPKTLLFLVAFLPQFISIDQPAFGQILVLGVIVMGVATLTDAIYAVLAGSVRHALSTARLRLLSRVSGLTVMAGGVWLALMRHN